MLHNGNTRQTLLLVLLTLCGISPEAKAQLTISRQVFATFATSSTPANTRAMRFTAHAGEWLTGTSRGEDFAVTAGFQQPQDAVLTSIVDLAGMEHTVTVFPNPAVESFTVDLGAAAAHFDLLEVVDVWGRVVLSRELTTGRPREGFTDLGSLPSGTLHLRARQKNGTWHPIGRLVLINR